jgi:8-oxo-dGTP diphosphatase
MSIHDYEHPALTADVVLLALGDGDVRVLLVQRGNPPFQGAWAFPGGFVDVGEPPEDAAARELREETGIQGLNLTQFRAFGAPGRDPRGHVVSIVYLSVIDVRNPPTLEPGSDAAGARWWSIGRLPTLAFDHRQILTSALARLRAALTYPSQSACAPFRLPAELSVGDLRAACRRMAAVLDDG